MTITPDMLAAMLDGEADTAWSIAAGHAFRRAAALVREHLGRTPGGGAVGAARLSTTEEAGSARGGPAGTLPERAEIPVNSPIALAAARPLRRTGTFQGALVVVAGHGDGTWKTYTWGETSAHRLMAGAMADACLDGLTVNDAPDRLIRRTEEAGHAS